MNYKVRKGLDSPCKIHGFLVNDYYVILIIYAISGLLMISMISTAIQAHSLMVLLLPLVICFITIFIVRYQLYRKSNQPKYPKSNVAVTISNRLFLNILKTK